MRGCASAYPPDPAPAGRVRPPDPPDPAPAGRVRPPDPPDPAPAREALRVSQITGRYRGLRSRNTSLTDLNIQVTNGIRSGRHGRSSGCRARETGGTSSERSGAAQW